MKFAEAGLFRLTMSPSGRVRSEVRQCRADARFVSGKWLGKTLDSDEHLFATDEGVFRTRTVKRVPDTEQRQGDSLKNCQGTPRDSLARRPVGRPPQATPPEAAASERPSAEAEEPRSAKAQDQTPPVVPHVPRAEETEPSAASGPMDTDNGGASAAPSGDEHPKEQSSAPAPSRPNVQAYWSVERDAQAADLPDEAEGGKFQQVEGMTTVDEKEVPCDFSVEFDETTKGVDEETVRAVLAAKKKELDTMEALDIFDVCEEMPIGAELITTRWENVPKGGKSRCRFVAREFKQDDPNVEGLYTSGSTTSTSRLVDMHGESLVDAEEATLRKEEEKFNQFVVTATDGLGLEQCSHQPSFFRRPGTTLLFDLHQDDFYVSGSNVEWAWLQEHLGPRLKLKPSEPLGLDSQYSYFTATRTRVDADTTHIAPRETA